LAALDDVVAAAPVLLNVPPDGVEWPELKPVEAACLAAGGGVEATVVSNLSRSESKASTSSFFVLLRVNPPAEAMTSTRDEMEVVVKENNTLPCL
jgi:hypothetical protein